MRHEAFSRRLFARIKVAFPGVCVINQNYDTNHDTIALHAAAPGKPSMGAPCNGCGVCCCVAACPLSRSLLGHRSGACPALVWRDGEARYVCGLVVAPAAHLPWLPEALAVPAMRLARRWIAAGTGCDCSTELD